ncbi:hypothetical protein Cst_c03120 [Thermoclostridium stercorarium subsp. stercorarium DSM 8532]|uniref:Uncharacterized protein n=1 Tax=Thermoclostridium stercorarium (strain ATCC 35414 / DSM 8532 / NCIMB 11754) TaxID=1121335 RepID=L7VLG6_THES1|nr:hypothetical protein Cst_c03120 [Thermoclostridium stercorarium subsp. stercorarium DSM 8532]
MHYFRDIIKFILKWIGQDKIKMPSDTNRLIHVFSFVIE